MKTHFAKTIVGALILMTACNSEVKKENLELKEQIEKITAENESFNSEAASLTTSIENYKILLNEIDKNLKEVDENKTMVGKLNAELKDGGKVEDRILSRVTAIKALMANSRSKILALDKSLNELRKNNGAQSEEILKLDRELKAAVVSLIEKEKELTNLTEQQDTMEDENQSLQMAYEEQLVITEQLKKILNRAHMFIGTAAELKEKGIIAAEGGFIGIGKVKVLNANSNEDLFKNIEKDKTDTLVLESNKVKLISEHPAATYSMIEGEEKTTLIIVDKTGFWKQGNYLVVQIK